MQLCSATTLDPAPDITGRVSFWIADCVVCSSDARPHILIQALNRADVSTAGAPGSSAPTSSLRMCAGWLASLQAGAWGWQSSSGRQVVQGPWGGAAWIGGTTDEGVQQLPAGRCAAWE